MLKITLRKRFALIVATFLSLGSSLAQINTPAGATRPFGSNESYEYGMMPTNLPSGGAYGLASDVGAIYNDWKRDYVENCGSDRARIKFDNTAQTVSEGIGYGMLLAAYAADKDLFDRLWAYYKSHRNQNGVMHWKIQGCDAVANRNGATDAELDAAMALIVANHQWPNSNAPHNYVNDGVALINAIKDHETAPDGTFFNGDMWHPDCRNPSYQAPAYARAFKTFMANNGSNQDGFWDNVAAKTEQLFENNAHSSSGLSTNWCTPAGPPSSACSGSGTAPDKFGYDACRAPWRQGVDVLWYGSSSTGSVQTIIDRQADFWIGKGGAGTVQGSNNMNHDGSGSGDHNAAFVGPVGAMAMAASNSSAHQSFTNALYTENLKNNLARGYFTKILQMMGLFVQTGNFWNPYGSGGNKDVNVAPQVAFTSPSNNADFCAGETITLSVSASDSDGEVQSVSFYQNGNLLGTDQTAPYTFDWNDATSGDFNLEAIAIDDDGAEESATLNISVNASPAKPIVTSPVNYCTSSTSSPLLASGNNLTWYTQETGGNGSSTAPTPSTANAGTISYYVSQSTNGCESERSEIVVNVNSTDQPVAETSYNYCQGEQSQALSAQGNNLLWYTSATNGNGSPIAPQPNTSSTGVSNYWVSQTIDGCESDRLEITVTVGDQSVAPSVTSNNTICQYSSIDLNDFVTGVNLTWYETSTSTGSTQTPSFNTSDVGNSSIYVSQADGGCESDLVEITFDVIAAPQAPNVESDVVYEIDESAVQLSATGSNLTWYDNSDRINGSSVAPTPSTDTEGIYSYYVSSSNGTCESELSEIVVTVSNSLKVYRTASAITIDGQKDDYWQAVALTAIENEVLPTINGVGDLSGSFCLLWDDNYFYIYAEINDDELINDSPNSYLDDGLEIFFDFGNEKSGPYDGDDYQFTFRWNDNDVATSQGASAEGIDFVMVESSTGYMFEAQIPWSNLGNGPEKGQLHGFDIHVNDDDDGDERDGKMAWFSESDDAWQNSALFGTILLDDLITSTSDIHRTEVTVYPNPFSTTIYVDGLNEQTDYTIISSTGQAVLHGSTDGVIVTDQLSVGIYYLSLQLGSGTEVLKVVKM